MCSQSDAFEKSFEFLNENSVADILFLLFAFFQNNPPVNVVCSCFCWGCFLFRGGRMHSELIYYMCSRSVVYEELVLAFYYTKYA